MTDAKIRITAKDDTSGAFKTAAANINGLKAGASGLAASFVGLAGGLSIAGIVAFTKSAVDSIDALNDIADATGSSVENISALEDIAARTGTTMDTVTGALVKFNGILNSATPDSGASAALRALGLEADRLKQLDPAEALRQTAVALAGFADDGNKARIVQELFGKSVKDSAPFLKDLAEKAALVPTVTKEMAAEAEKFNKELYSMQKNISDAARYLSGDLIIGLNKAAKAFRESGLIGGLQTFLTGDDQYKNDKALVNQTNELLALEKEISALRAGGSALDGALATKKEKRLAALKEEIKVTQNYRKVLAGDGAPEPVKPSLTKLPDTARPRTGGNGGGASRQSEADRYLETLQRQFERTQELTVVDQLLLDIQKGRLGKVSTGQQAQLLRLAEQLDSVKAQTEAEKLLAEAIKQTSKEQEEFFDAVMRSDDAKQNQLANLLAATPTGNLEKQRSDVQLLTAEFESGRISEELYLEAVTSRLDLAADKMKTTKTLAEDLNLSFASAFEDAIVGGKGLSEVLKGLEQDIIRIITRKLVTEPLGNAISGALGGLIPGLFSADGGGYTGSGPRSGGVDGKGGFMAVLHPQETVVDHTRGQTLGKSNTVNLVVNQQFAPGTSRTTTLQAASDARRQLEYAGRNL
jgi:hypothetical protein